MFSQAMDRSFMNSSARAQGVEGWLALLCFALVIGSPVRTVYQLSVGYQDASKVFDAFPGVRNVFLIDTALSILLMLFSIRAGLGLWLKWPGAVGVAKAFLLLLVGYALLSPVLALSAGLPPEVNQAMMPELVTGAIQPILFAALWYSYLSFSKRVTNTYHASSRSRYVQMVGRDCVSCTIPIADATTANPCAECERPLHVACSADTVRHLCTACAVAILPKS